MHTIECMHLELHAIAQDRMHLHANAQGWTNLHHIMFLDDCNGESICVNIPLY